MMKMLSSSAILNERENPYNSTAIHLHVKVKAKSVESRDTILSALKVFVDYQLEQPVPGTLLFHFSRPDPDNDPLLLQFCELYTSPDVFFEHSDTDEMRGQYAKVFIPPGKNIKSSRTNAYGLPVIKHEQMKAVCNMMGAKYTETVEGYLIHSKPLDVLENHSDPVLMTCEITAKTIAEDAVTNNIKSISNQGNNEALMFNVGNIADNLTTFQITAVYPSNAQLTKHLQATTSEFQQVAKLSSSFSCLLFGEVSAASKSKIEKCGFPVNYRSTDVGYVLHPLAKMAFKSGPTADSKL